MRGLRAKIAWGLLCLIAAGAAFLVLLDTLFPPRLDHYRDRSSAVLDRDGRLLRAFTTSGGIWRFAAHPSEVDPLYLRMLERDFHPWDIDDSELVEAWKARLSAVIGDAGAEGMVA